MDTESLMQFCLFAIKIPLLKNGIIFLKNGPDEAKISNEIGGL